MEANAEYNECNALNEQSKFDSSEGIDSTRIISRGSRPKSLQEWVDADFTPVPIKRYLTPLSHLFKDEWLSKNEYYGFDKSLSGTKIATMFQQASSVYCSLMLEDVLDDNCELLGNI